MFTLDVYVGLHCNYGKAPIKRRRYSLGLCVFYSLERFTSSLWLDILLNCANSVIYIIYRVL